MGFRSKITRSASNDVGMATSSVNDADLAGTRNSRKEKKARKRVKLMGLSFGNTTAVWACWLKLLFIDDDDGDDNQDTGSL